MDRFFATPDQDSSRDEVPLAEEKALRRSGILIAAVGALLTVLFSFVSALL